MKGIPALSLLPAVAVAVGCSDFATEPDRYPDELRVSPDTAVLVQGDAVRFLVEVLDQHGVPFESPPAWAPPRWSASDEGFVQLDAAGDGVALEPGESRVRVELAGLHAESLVRTNPREIQLSVPFAYVTQGTQSRNGGVPLVAGREGLVRVYVAGSGINFFEPAVGVRFFHDGSEVHAVRLEPDGPSIPYRIDEGDLRLSYDAVVPGHVIQPGLEMLVEVDPEGVVPSTSPSQLRVPATGLVPLEVRPVHPFRLRLVPVHLSRTNRMSELDAGSAAELAALTGEIFPLADFDVDVREAFTTSARLDTENGWLQLIEEILFLRHDDGSDRYYYGGMDPPRSSGIAGIGYIGYPTSIGLDDDPEVLAHELGHNLGLRHAPCGGPAGVDGAYPYAQASIGQYGYERSFERLHSPEDRYDLMSYCDPVWISDYNYRNVLEYRDTSAYDAVFAGGGGAARQRTLVVWGGVRGGEPVLAPAFEWTGPVRMPDGGGRYRLEGLDATGLVLFDVAVEPLELDHGDASHFLVALPAEVAQPDRLERLRLTGGEGRIERTRRPALATPTVELRRRGGARPGAGAAVEGRWSEEQFPLAIVRSRATGRVVAISRDGVVALPDRADAVEVWLSDGVRGHRARLVER